LHKSLFKSIDGFKRIEVEDKSTSNDVLSEPSITTLKEIERWIEEDRELGEEYKSYQYPLTQYYGIHIGVIDMLQSQIDQVSDLKSAKQIVSYVGEYSGEFVKTLDELKESEKKGIVPPKFIIDQVINQLENFTSKRPDENILYISFEKKVDGIEKISAFDKQKLYGSMKSEIKNKMYPEYNRLLTYFKNIEKTSNNDAGVWKFKDGDSYYNYILKHNISEDMTPDKVHNLGLQEIERLQKEIDSVFKKLGYRGKSSSEYMKELNQDKRFLYPDDEAGKIQVVEDYQRIIDNMDGILKDMFSTLPKGKVEVLPMPDFARQSAPQAYYYPSQSDFNLPGIFYVNIDKPTYSYDMESIAYHEAVPGHHLQMALQKEFLELKYPDKADFYIPAYVEGWGLYAENLADEYGMYSDSYSRLGYLRGELLRAVRLVVDTGIHHKRWTREYAIEYMKSFECIPEEYVPIEVDRYIVNPGQACSYKIGVMKILELREKAKAELGEKFNIKEFHDVILRNGPMPLEVMEREVEKYIDSK
jgi:uncharacterized protein (DUF885 family)